MSVGTDSQRSDGEIGSPFVHRLRVDGRQDEEEDEASIRRHDPGSDRASCLWLTRLASDYLSQSARKTAPNKNNKDKRQMIEWVARLPPRRRRRRPSNASNVRMTTAGAADGAVNHSFLSVIISRSKNLALLLIDFDSGKEGD